MYLLKVEAPRFLEFGNILGNVIYFEVGICEDVIVRVREYRGEFYNEQVKRIINIESFTDVL